MCKKYKMLGISVMLWMIFIPFVSVAESDVKNVSASLNGNTIISDAEFVIQRYFSALSNGEIYKIRESNAF